MPEINLLNEKVQFETPFILNGKIFEKKLIALDLVLYYKKCLICQWNECDVDYVLMDVDQGYVFNNVLPLCPNHHKAFRELGFSGLDLEKVQEFLWSISNSISPF